MNLLKLWIEDDQLKNKRGILALVFALFMFLSLGLTNATASIDEDNDKIKHSVFHVRKYKHRKKTK